MWSCINAALKSSIRPFMVTSKMQVSKWGKIPALWGGCELSPGSLWRPWQVDASAPTQTPGQKFEMFDIQRCWLIWNLCDSFGKVVWRDTFAEQTWMIWSQNFFRLLSQDPVDPCSIQFSIDVKPQAKMVADWVKGHLVHNARSCRKTFGSEPKLKDEKVLAVSSKIVRWVFISPGLQDYLWRSRLGTFVGTPLKLSLLDPPVHQASCNREGDAYVHLQIIVGWDFCCEKTDETTRPVLISGYRF